MKDRLAPGPYGWRNFYRPTDYIGKRVFIPPGGALNPESSIADTEIIEATYLASGLRARLFPPRSHSDYWREGVIKLWLEAAVANFRSPPKPKRRQRKR